MRTMRKINKPIKFFGLSSGQFAVFMLVVALIIIFSIFKQLHPVFIIGIVSGILGLSGMLFGTLKKEHKAGNPDYLTGISVRSATPQHLKEHNHHHSGTQHSGIQAGQGIHGPGQQIE